MSLENTRVLLTGGTGGIGNYLARAFVDAGADLQVIGRSVPQTRGAGHMPADLSSISDIERVAKLVAGWEPEILINLAGSQFFGQFEDQATSEVHRSYILNLVAPTILSQAVVPAMKERGSGQIVNVGSIFGSINYPHFVTYSVAKAGLRALTQSLRRELKGSGIQLTYVAPRAVDSGLNRGGVAKFVELTKMAADPADLVAQRIFRAVRKKERDVYIGVPERFFVWMNAMSPGVVDLGLAQQTRDVRNLLKSGINGEPDHV